MPTSDELCDLLLDLDQRSYKAYKQIQGRYAFPGFTLVIDYVQGDPFAAPSRLRVLVPQMTKQGKPNAGFPGELYSSSVRAVALRDYLARQFDRSASDLRSKRGSGKSGLISIASPGQEILERTSVLISQEQVEARFLVGLPARGRSVLGRQAAELLCEDVPELVARSLLYRNLKPDAVQKHVETAEDAHWLRQQLPTRGLVAFIPDGAVLPRESGVSEKPLREHPVAFTAPDSLRVSFDCPHRGNLSGMGIPQGVTLIVGGGYHGKSTLLRAIALGVYNHIPGDGREAVVTDPTAVKIRAEDGRRIAGVNISPFINHLPQGRSTERFSTDNASGSTSQAASIIEALEVESRVLLVDEDTSATNFMIRDRRMQALIAKDKEPITPFIDKIRQLYDDYGVSTILVMGGSGDYFDVADTVIGMADFQPHDLTQQAKAIAHQYATDRTPEGGQSFGPITHRIPLAKRLDSPRRDRDDRGPKTRVRDVDELRFGSEDIDLSAVEQIIDTAQLRGIGAAIAHIQENLLDNRTNLMDIVDQVQQLLDESGLDAFTASPQGDLAYFRRFELAAALNRLRSLEIQ
ncbi:MAG: ABC-ATPase domain-containing protein [Synechococcales bacterium]|nr:ABC-ATPase domain-containing protein [Synechococcales bacterium]